MNKVISVLLLLKSLRLSWEEQKKGRELFINENESAILCFMKNRSQDFTNPLIEEIIRIS